jgi:small-conductance mechanosensitive channel
MRLARLIEFVVVSVALSGLLLFALVRIVDAMLGVALRVRPLRLLRAVQEHRTSLERWLQHLVRLAAVALWTGSIASTLSIAGPLWDRLGAVFGTAVGWGAVSVSLGDLLAFAVVVWLAFQLSAALRALLEEDVFSRVELGRGVSSALSSLAHYLVLLLGFLLGLGVLGIDLTRITIIAGALGVGIGFGLQNVVNNFV